MNNAIRRPWAGLQARMTLAYVGATVGVVIVLECAVLLLLLVAATTEINTNIIPEIARQVAQKYALLAADQGRGVALDPRATLQPGRPDTLALPGHTWDIGHAPYRATLASDPVMFVVVIAPDLRVLTSSYPARFASQAPIAAALPDRATAIAASMQGRATSGSYTVGATQIAYAVAPIWNWHTQPIGAIYVEIPGTTLIGGGIWTTVLHLLEVSCAALLIGMLPIGALFGLLTTRGSVQRIHQLAKATSQFAAGDYARRVPVRHRDEISQLEDHFNQMAAQLTATIAQRQELASQNARLAERGRISRDLHDSIKQQVFAIGLQLGAALSLLEADPATAVQHMQQADTLAHAAQQELTTLIHELRPLALQTQDFAAALSDYVADWSRQHAIAADVQLPAASTLPASVEDSLLRVAQEALANVARHSQAQHVHITLACADDEVTLRVADDGRGFTPQEADAGVGLHSMQERMHALGGTLTVQSAPGQGTRIIATCPNRL
jgi:NarL family two-component system sensor histidine kinase LiaS